MNILHILITLVAIIVILVIMMQSKGAGLSIVPGSNDFGKFERRGPEKILHQMTIILVVLFVGLSMVSYFIS